MKHEAQEIIIHPTTGRVKVRTINNEPSMTQQQFKDECDVNNIIKQYQKTGEFSHVTKKLGSYQDFSNITDYQSMLHAVTEAHDAFMALPAVTRARFSNDPGELIDFLNNPQNAEEAMKLGLLDPTKLQTQIQNPNENQNESKNKNQKQQKTTLTQQQIDTDSNIPPKAD